jgi:hypothetical protein
MGFFFIIILSKFNELSGDDIVAVITGTICALGYVISGIYAIHYAYPLGQKRFNKIFIFSIAFRFIVLITLIILVLKLTAINQVVFLVSFFIWYFLFQILEVISLKNMQTKEI